MDSANKVFGFFLGLLLAYVLAYCTCLRTEKRPMIGSLGLMSWERSAEYMVGGQAVKRFFTPLNTIDRRLRPDYWSGVDECRNTCLHEILSHTPFFPSWHPSFEELVNSELFRPIPLPPRPIPKRKLYEGRY